MTLIINTSIQYAKLPLDAGQYIQEALMTVDRESDYSPGEDDYKKTRLYNLLYLRAIEAVLSTKSIPALRNKYTPEDVVEGYGPLPADFLTIYQYIYDIRIKRVNDIMQLCGKAGQNIEYVTMPQAIGSLTYKCRNAIQDRFLLNCKTIDTGFMAKMAILEANAYNSISLWLSEAELYNQREERKGYV